MAPSRTNSDISGRMHAMRKKKGQLPKHGILSTKLRKEKRQKLKSKLLNEKRNRSTLTLASLPETLKEPSVEEENGSESSEVDEQDIEQTVVLQNGDDSTSSDSVKEGRDAFAWLIAPISPEEFFKNAWEKAPLHVKRTGLPDYYKVALSTDKINQILRDNYILFSKHVDVTSYRDGQRQTHNPPGRATAARVWDFYRQGCSVRMLNPQTFNPALGRLNAMLQEYFGCFVGANSYLTPPNSQGFAPHYDDIEAFILQIEGRKHWKVYKPREAQEVLPRFSSPNLSQEELDAPVLEVTLGPGDLLYFPRGFIHQASTTPDVHSLHVTLSCYQRFTWGDLLEKLVPAALAVALEDDVEFRRGLPLGFLRHLGVAHSDSPSAERQAALEHVATLMQRLVTYAPVDAAADQLAKGFMHDAMPPYLSPEEIKCSVYSGNLMRLKKKGQVAGSIALCKDSRVKLTRAHILRLVKEDDTDDSVQIYHCADNSSEYHAEDVQMMEVSSDAALAVEALVQAYPAYTAVGDLPLDSLEEKLELANSLWQKGLLLTEHPLEN